MTTRKTPFVSAALTPAARDALRRATVDLTSPAGLRLSMSDVLLAVLAVAGAHQEETLVKLREAAAAKARPSAG
ncbi:hypothetical protein [Kitasatospora sp. NPDC058046]|uniref:hypothetical protein n=1 Tax=Kitasatospora sp. NPDC058046 TaxID=3346312 RepID=UPI0036DBAD26